MNLMRFSMIVVMVLCCSISRAEEIPLSEVWAHMMPGTTKIQTLEPDTPDDDRLMAKIGEILSSRIRQKTGPSFAVEQNGLKGLENAYKVFSGQEKLPTSLSKDTEISVVFYTHRSNYYVHLSRVVIDQNTIRIMYRLVPHHEQEMTVHFALIPIGKLPTGNYNVEVIAEPIEQELLRHGLKEPTAEKKSTIASSPFKFRVS